MEDKPVYPSDVADKVLVRMPDGMRDRLKALGKVNKRTLNAEIVARLESSFSPQADSSQLSTLAAELAKAKRDSAYAAYVGEQWLVDAVFLWDMLLQTLEKADALGISEILPKDDREIAADIGDKVDDEFKRHSKEFDPLALHGHIEASEAEFQKALQGVARLMSNSPVPDKKQAATSSAIRERIKNRKRREFLPVDAYTESEIESFKTNLSSKPNK